MKKQFSLILILLTTIFSAFSQGFYLEFNISSAGKEASMNGTMKSYYQDGNTRGDISMTVPQMPSGGINMSTLILKDNPSKVYMLDEKAKTYSEMDLGKDQDWKDAPESDYEVTVIGKESVNGYNATHVKVQKKGAPSPEEFWNSTDVAGYAEMQKIKTKYTGKENLNKALEAKGAKGFPVRVKTTEHGQSITVDLVKAEKRSNPSDLYSLKGYTKSASGNVAPAGMDVNQMMKDVQNMSPEERQKWMEEMQKKYKPE